MAKARELPIDSCWEQIEMLVTAMRDTGVSVYPITMGGGFELPGVMCAPFTGTSALVPMSLGLNSKEASSALLTFDSGGSFANPTVANCLAGHAYLELLRCNGLGSDPDKTVGICITGCIAAGDQLAGLRGGHRACVSVRTAKGTRHVTAQFRHTSELGFRNQNEARHWQSQLACMIALNTLAAALGLDQFPFAQKFEVAVLGGHGELTKVNEPNTALLFPQFVGPLVSAHFQPHPYTFVGVDGVVTQIDSLSPKDVLIPMSCNPLTPGHDDMARHIQRMGRRPVLAITMKNAEKSEMPWGEAHRRASLVTGRWPVVIVRDQFLLLNMIDNLGVDVAIGADTALRLFNPKYCAHFGGPEKVYCQLKAERRKVFVFPRTNRDGVLEGVADVIPLPYQDSRVFIEQTNFFSAWSSTAMRTSAANH